MTVLGKPEYLHNQRKSWFFCHFSHANFVLLQEFLMSDEDDGYIMPNLIFYLFLAIHYSA